MVAVIKTGYSLRRIFNYNENKVAENVARCIGAVNYPKDLPDLSLSNKINMLLNQAGLNTAHKKHSVHISLNFSPTEELTDRTMNDIASEYMERIGFGDQPYLVYRHLDAAHPHIHIVTLRIDAQGDKIDMHQIYKRKSRPACIDLEKKYNLVSTSKKQLGEFFRMRPIPLQQVQYGEVESRAAIGKVLEHVLENYRYTSMAELNAVLGLYNVRADRGGDNTRTFRHGGLLYRIVNPKGDFMGKPIKASSFHNSPGLTFLKSQFSRGKSGRKPHATALKNTIDLALMNPYITNIDRLTGYLSRRGVDVVLRTNHDNFIYGITFIDHRNKCVFNGSQLDKSYGVSAIKDRCAANHDRLMSVSGPQRQVDEQESNEYWLSVHPQDMAEILFQSEYVEQLPYHLRIGVKNRKKEKGYRGISSNR